MPFSTFVLFASAFASSLATPAPQTTASIDSLNSQGAAAVDQLTHLTDIGSRIAALPSTPATVEAVYHMNGILSNLVLSGFLGGLLGSGIGELGGLLGGDSSIVSGLLSGDVLAFLGRAAVRAARWALGTFARRHRYSVRTSRQGGGGLSGGILGGGGGGCLLKENVEALLVANKEQLLPNRIR
ncbi:hypothetical protein C8R47DRAFT_1209947 [Mycena vitilis]|nr:hypothetical protein C8R47DRAFT_1209947 [Mycena vitilis]